MRPVPNTSYAFCTVGERDTIMMQANAGPGIKAPPKTFAEFQATRRFTTDIERITGIAKEAEDRLAHGQQNMAIGGMMIVERELERLNGLWQSVRALHNL